MYFKVLLTLFFLLSEKIQQKYKSKKNVSVCKLGHLATYLSRSFRHDGRSFLRPTECDSCRSHCADWTDGRRVSLGRLYRQGGEWNRFFKIANSFLPPTVYSITMSTSVFRETLASCTAGRRCAVHKLPQKTARGIEDTQPEGSESISEHFPLYLMTLSVPDYTASTDELERSERIDYATSKIILDKWCH